MTILDTAARTRILALCDDVDAVTATTALQDAALLAAFHATYLQACATAPDKFSMEASVTTNAAGVGDLSAIDPMRILAVNLFVTPTRTPIPMARISDGPTNALGVKVLKVQYFPALAFPAGGASFVWGQASLDIPALDDLMCKRAASELCALMDQPNGHLEKLVARAEADAGLVSSFSQWRTMRGGRSSGLSYVMTDAVSLQLVRG